MSAYGRNTARHSGRVSTLHIPRRAIAAGDRDAEGQRRDGGRPGAWEHGAPAPPPDDGARRERLMLATLLNHPELLAVVAEELAGMDFRTEGLRRLSGVLIDFAAAAADMADDKCSAALRERLAAADALGYADRLLWPDEWDGGHLAESFARADASAEAALAGFRHLAARHRRQAVLADLQAAEDALSERMDKESLARLVHLAAAVELIGQTGGERGAQRRALTLVLRYIHIIWKGSAAADALESVNRKQVADDKNSRRWRRPTGRVTTAMTRP